MLLLTLTLSTIFIHVPHKGEIAFILNPEVTLSYNQYFWMFCEHFIMVIMALIIWDEAETYKKILFVFVLIQIADTLQFVLAYDDLLKDYLITCNILKVAVFFAAIVLWRKEK